MIEKIGLSDINLSHCIYMSAGAHANETIEQIIERKQREVDKCGWSLWAFSSPIVNAMYEFCKKNEDVYVVMPLSGVNTKGTPRRASVFGEYGQEEMTTIPEEIMVTYTAARANALVIEKYFLIDESDAKFIKGNYERIKYFNGVELLEETMEKGTENCKKISIAAKLKKPYIVNIK